MFVSRLLCAPRTPRIIDEPFNGARPLTARLSLVFRLLFPVETTRECLSRARELDWRITSRALRVPTLSRPAVETGSERLAEVEKEDLATQRLGPVFHSRCRGIGRRYNGIKGRRYEESSSHLRGRNSRRTDYKSIIETIHSVPPLITRYLLLVCLQFQHNPRVWTETSRGFRGIQSSVATSLVNHHSKLLIHFSRQSAYA